MSADSPDKDKQTTPPNQGESLLPDSPSQPEQLQLSTKSYTCSLLASKPAIEEHIYKHQSIEPSLKEVSLGISYKRKYKHKSISNKKMLLSPSEHYDGIGAYHDEIMDRKYHRYENKYMSARRKRDIHSMSGRHFMGMKAAKRTSGVPYISQQYIADANGKKGNYSGAHLAETDESSGRRLYTPNGEGRMEYWDGSWYEGEWKAGKYHGEGVLQGKVKWNVYKGEWADGRRQGTGHEVMSNGDKYEGEWATDYRHGFGRFTHKSGWSMEGRFRYQRCMECKSVSGLKNENCESMCVWAKQQEPQKPVPFLLDKILESGIDKKVLLRQSCVTGWVRVFEMLLDEGYDVETRDEDGQTLLHLACGKKVVKMYMILTERGASVDLEDNRGFTPLDAAILERRWVICERLCKDMLIDMAMFNYKVQPLYWAAELSRVLVVKELVDRGADMNTVNQYGRTPLHAASRNGRLDIVKFLVEKNADVNARDRWKKTPLRLADMYKKEDVVEFLRSKGGTE